MNVSLSRVKKISYAINIFLCKKLYKFIKLQTCKISNYSWISKYKKKSFNEKTCTRPKEIENHSLNIFKNRRI